MIQNGGIYANVAIQLGCIAILECMYILVEKKKSKRNIPNLPLGYNGCIKL